MLQKIPEMHAVVDERMHAVIQYIYTWREQSSKKNYYSGLTEYSLMAQMQSCFLNTHHDSSLH